MRLVNLPKHECRPASGLTDAGDIIAVLKFGGTSLKNTGRIRHAAEIIKSRLPAKVVVIASAMGDTTDHLLERAYLCAKKPDRRELDLLLSTGEQVSISLLSMTLSDMGVRAIAFTGQQVGISTDGNHGSAQILGIDQERIREAFLNHDVIVVAGFQGVASDGSITTLGRGGSDTTAVAMAGALSVPVCEIYTDVDGMFTADPMSVSAARLLTSVSFEQAFAMAEAGASVIHPRAVAAGRDSNVSIRVRNTFKPEHQGTLIARQSTLKALCRLTGAAVNRIPESKQAAVSLVGHELDADRRLLDSIEEALQAEGIALMKVESSQCRISLHLEDSLADRALALLHDRFVLCEKWQLTPVRPAITALSA